MSKFQHKLWLNFWFSLMLAFYSAFITKIFYYFSNFSHITILEAFIVSLTISFILLIGINK